MHPTKNKLWKCGICRTEYSTRASANSCCLCYYCGLFPKTHGSPYCLYCFYGPDTMVGIARHDLEKATAKLKEVEKNVAIWEKWSGRKKKAKR